MFKPYNNFGTYKNSTGPCENMFCDDNGACAPVFEKLRFKKFESKIHCHPFVWSATLIVFPIVSLNLSSFGFFCTVIAQCEKIFKLFSNLSVLVLLSEASICNRTCFASMKLYLDGYFNVCVSSDINRYHFPFCLKIQNACPVSSITLSMLDDVSIFRFWFATKVLFNRISFQSTVKRSSPTFTARGLF